MNIAILTSSFPLDPDDPAAAAGLFVRDFALELARHGPNIHVLTQDKGSGCKHEPAEIQVHCYPWGGGTKALSQLKLFKPVDLLNAYRLIANARRELAELHLQYGFDHVLAMWAVPAGLIAAKLCQSKNIPLSVWCLGSDIWTYGKIPILRGVVGSVIQKATHRFADGIKLGLDAEKLSGLPFEFLPSSRKLPVQDFEPARLSGDNPKFLFIGRYATVKGIDVLLDAFIKFRNKENRGSLFLLGGGTERESIVQQVNQNPILKQHVSVGDYANAETVVRFGKAADVVVIPSRMESIPVVLSDAAQLAKPVIVSDVGDMGSIVRESEAGIVVPAENSEALANAMSQFSTNGPTFYASGVERLTKQFDVTQTAKQFLDRIHQKTEFVSADCAITEARR